MNPEDRDRTVEALIDEALARHSRLEPRPGLERRILANLADQTPSMGWSRWAWAFASMALIAGVTLVVIRLHGPRVQRNTAEATLQTTAPQVLPPTPRPLPALQANASHRLEHGVSRRMAVHQGVPQPRLAQFPSPTPLSEQELLLIRFVKQHRDEAVQFAKIQNQPLEDLKIEDLKIAPIAEDSKPNSDEER